jgi:zinc protease
VVVALAAAAATWHGARASDGAAAIAPGTPPVTAEPAFHLPVEELTLDNGARVLLAPRPGAALLAAAWATRRGAGDEPPAAAGVAHLVEHLLHQGTPRVSASDYARLYAEAGAVGLDARTDHDLTAYFVQLPPSQLELWLWLESDRLLRPSLAGLDRERSVIAEERRQRVEAVPDGPLGEELLALLWGDHPYGRPAAGTPESLARLSTGDVESFFAASYGAPDLTLALAGDFDVARARELARRYLGRLPARRDGAPAGERDGAKPVVGPPAAAAAPAGERLVERACACPTQARILYPTVPASHPDRPALDVLAGVLAGRGGRLHRRLVVERGLAFAAGAFHQVGRQGGSFTVTVESAGAAPPAALVEAWDEELRVLQGRPPDDAELRRVRNQATTDAWRGLREPLDLALRLLVADAQGGWRALETWPAAVLGVDAAAVQRVARDYLQPSRRVVSHVTRQEVP